ncbi:unnamed protein product [Nyctereutes procyonoides]|uniref:(raccoon dog) hypothetical protein n=1 Tax=Nyctereutes procyonoides TaxID=34880 RepID=A0A811Y0P2_NYCPR|nr:unnamed protein product [Nyctereutes procyonoides]
MGTSITPQGRLVILTTTLLPQLPLPPVHICLAASHYRGSAPGAVRVALASSLPGNCTQHQAAIALNCICEHLCFISMYFVHPLARCVLKGNVQTNLCSFKRGLSSRELPTSEKSGAGCSGVASTPPSFSHRLECPVEVPNKAAHPSLPAQWCRPSWAGAGVRVVGPPSLWPQLPHLQEVKAPSLGSSLDQGYQEERKIRHRVTDGIFQVLITHHAVTK